MSARIGPGSVRELGPLRWGFARAAGRVTGTEAPAIFTTLGRTKGLFTGWLHFAGRLMPFGSLAARVGDGDPRGRPRARVRLLRVEPDRKR